MASSRILISSQTLTGSQSSVTFSSIPSTYTDLVLRISARTDESGATESQFFIEYNGSSTAVYSNTRLRGSGSAAASLRNSNESFIRVPDGTPGASATSNTFSNTEIYIPSYTASQNKPSSIIAMAENNTTTAYMDAEAGLWSNTAAITSVKIFANAFNSINFVTGSSFYLYGIKSS